MPHESPNMSKKSSAPDLEQESINGAARQIKKALKNGPSWLGRAKLAGFLALLSALAGLCGAGLELGRAWLHVQLGTGFEVAWLFWGSLAGLFSLVVVSLALTVFGAIGRKL